MGGRRSWRAWSKSPSAASAATWGRSLAPFLQPGEQVRFAFRATSGPRGTRWLGRSQDAELGGPGSLRLFGYPVGVRNHVVAVTDRAVLVVRLAMMTDSPKEVEARLPRETRLGPFAGNGVITVGGTEMYVWEVADLDAVQDADAEMGWDTGPPPSLF